ncbi:carbonic anhydrase [Ectobacillus ponti]
MMSGAAVLMSISLAACSAAKEEVKAVKTEAKTAAKAWSYEGETGPEHWGDLDAANAACANGKEQSPINLESAKAKSVENGELQVRYAPTVFSIANNGHTVQANAKAGTNVLTVDGVEYKLAQFHFHTPSEHELNGKGYDMELHLVHKSADNKLAVLGILLKAGQKNEQLAALWAAMPKEKTTADVALNAPVDLEALLPKNRATFRYNGSLTTPPCSEGVKWTVLEQPVEISEEQIKQFKSLFPDNHRPVQPVNSREVTKH